VAAARAFMEQMKLDYLFIIPTYLPPHKQISSSDDPLYRLKMCELAFAGVDGVVISDVEIRRGGKSYTYDTLKELSREGTRLFLLCGTDMVLTFDTWYRFEDILKMCYPVYVRREDDPLLGSRVVAKITEYYQKYGVMFRKIVTDPIPLSSTEIREAARAGRDISAMVPEGVAEFIHKNRLYLD
jgi:nicotinate-nucleotide adenylyltransferase